MVTPSISDSTGPLAAVAIHMRNDYNMNGLVCRAWEGPTALGLPCSASLEVKGPFRAFTNSKRESMKFGQAGSFLLAKSELTTNTVVLF